MNKYNFSSIWLYNGKPWTTAICFALSTLTVSLTRFTFDQPMITHFAFIVTSVTYSIVSAREFSRKASLTYFMTFITIQMSMASSHNFVYSFFSFKPFSCLQHICLRSRHQYVNVYCFCYKINIHSPYLSYYLCDTNLLTVYRFIIRKSKVIMNIINALTYKICHHRLYFKLHCPSERHAFTLFQRQCWLTLILATSNLL